MSTRGCSVASDACSIGEDLGGLLERVALGCCAASAGKSGITGDSATAVCGLTTETFARLAGFLDDRRGGGDIGGNSELKDPDLNARRVKLSTDLEVVRVESLGDVGSDGVAGRVLGREKGEVGPRGESGKDSEVPSACIGCASMPFSSGSGACATLMAENSEAKSRRLLDCSFLAWL